MDKDIQAYQTWQQTQGTGASAAQGGLPGYLQKFVTPAKAQNKGNLLTNNLNTIGQIGGGIGGFLLGGPLGGIAGAAGGGALGESLKRASLGEDQNLGESLTQGAIGAGNELIGQGLGKFILSPLLSKLGGAVSKTGENILEKQVANKTADLVSNEFGHVPATQRAGLNEVVSMMQQHGIEPTAENMARFAEAGTGGNGALNGIKNQLVMQGGQVHMGDIGQLVDEAITKQPSLGSIGNKQAPANIIRDALRQEIQQTIYGGKGSLTNTAEPMSVLDAAKNIFGYKASSGAEAAVYKDVRQGLINKLNEDAGISGLVSKYKVTPEDYQAILKAAGGNESLATHMVDQLNGATKLQDIQKAELPFVAAGRLSQAAGKAASSALPTSAATPSGLGMLGKLTGAAGVAAAPFTHGISLALPAAELIGKGVTGEVGQKVLGKGLSALGGLSGLTGQVAQRAIPPAFESGPQTAETTPQLSAQTNLPSTASSGSSTSSNMFSPAIMQAMALHDIQTTGGKNIDKIVQLNSIFGPKASSPSSNDLTRASDIQDAFSVLDAAKAQFDDLGGGEGSLGGLTADIPLVGQYLNPKGKAYNQTKVDTAAALAKALTGSARPAASVIEQYKHSLPDLTDSPEVAAQKLTNIRGQLSSRARNYVDVAPELQQLIGR